MSVLVQTATDAELEELLHAAPMRPLGRLAASSNGAVLVEVGRGADTVLAIHKPIALERPLWDYPHGTLALRERAAYVVCRGAGLELVPPTVLREGPWGLGSLQLWIGRPGEPGEPVVMVGPPEDVPQGWLEVLRGEDSAGHHVSLAHSGSADVRATAVLDAVLNNSDRKGGHLVRAPEGLRGFDHGVSLGIEPKLRTVLWGWAGEPLAAEDRERVERLGERLARGLGESLQDLLADDEIRALRERIAALLESGRHPMPSQDWPAVPWPAL